jgi:hypothetical protein
MKTSNLQELPGIKTKANIEQSEKKSAVIDAEIKKARTMVESDAQHVNFGSFTPSKRARS